MISYSKKLAPILALAAGSLLLSGCSDETVLQDPGNISPNNGVVSQTHFFIGFDPVDPAVYDIATNSFDLNVEMTVTATIGDRNNQTLTDSHTIYFETEWGLIEPSCITEQGECSVTWRPSGNLIPADLETTIIAYTSGEEAFEDTNGNGTFDDGEFFYDVEEPWINVDGSENPWVFNSGTDIPVDTVNPLDPTGVDLTHNIADGQFNGGGCTHSTLCSPYSSTTVWDTASILITGGNVAVVVVVSGLSGTVVLQNNAADDLTVTADGTYVFATPLVAGGAYNVTVLTQPAAQVCTVTSNAAGTVDGTNASTTVTVDCV